MNLKSSVKLAVAAAMLGASMLASAQTTVVPSPQPSPIPAAGLQSFTASTDPVYVAIWDPTSGASLTEYLGLTAGQISPTQLTNHLDFGVLSGFSTTFAANISGGTVSSLQFEVFSTGTTNAGNTSSVYTTSRDAASDLVFQGTATNAGAVSAIGGANSAINDWTINRMNAGNTCNKVNPCTAPNTNDPKSFALPAFADNFGGNINAYQDPNAHTSGNVGTSLSFFLLTGDNTDPFAPVTSVAGYQGKWSVSTAGDLTYNVSSVPLPAAAWLLLSGLAGLGVIGRRRNGVAVAA